MGSESSAGQDPQAQRWLLQRAALLGAALAMLLAAVLVASLTFTRPAVLERVEPPAGAAPTAPPGAGGAPAATAPGEVTVNPPVSEAPRTLAPGEAPPQWPAGLPVPGDIAVLGGGAVSDTEWRWVMTTSRNWPLAGGQFVDQLTQAGWELDLSSTASGLTVIGRKGNERLSIVLRPGGADVPAGWALLEVIYQSEPPQVELEPDDPGADERKAAEQGA